jgi:hypothetical protein
MPLPQIDEAEATGEVAALFEDIRSTMRSTFLPTVIRALAVHPSYLAPAWRALRPNLESMDAEQLAGQLRVACVDRLKPLVGRARPPAVKLSDTTRAEIRAVLETFFYVIPKFLVVVTALGEAWEGRPIAGRPHGDRVRKLPRGAPASMPAIPLLPSVTADQRVQRLFEAAARILGACRSIEGRPGFAGAPPSVGGLGGPSRPPMFLGRPAVPSLYRTLARWPDYLEAVWESVIDEGVLAGYRAAAPRLLEELAHGCHGLPFAFTLDRATVSRSLDDEAVAAIGRILATFRQDTAETLFQIARLLRDLESSRGGPTPRGEPH